MTGSLVAKLLVWAFGPAHPGCTGLKLVSQQLISQTGSFIGRMQKLKVFGLLVHIYN